MRIKQKGEMSKHERRSSIENNSLQSKKKVKRKSE